MRFANSGEFRDWPAKAVTVFGMSGVGKTTLADMLQGYNWFHYSVDYRIGTRYMGEHIVDNFKREAMRVPFLHDLLRSDSIYISSNLTFKNLDPLSTYLGKPGDPNKGGLTLAEYKRRQAQHRQAEKNALLDVPDFIERSRNIYGYQHFVCDSGGSLCEVTDPDDGSDPALRSLIDNTLMLFIEGTPEHARMLVERFRKQPKPMYYQPAFLDRTWTEYKKLKRIAKDSEVDPDDFVAWGFEQLLHHRLPLYRAIAKNFGYTVKMEDVPAVASEKDFIALVSRAIDGK